MAKLNKRFSQQASNNCRNNYRKRVHWDNESLCVDVQENELAFVGNLTKIMAGTSKQASKTATQKPAAIERSSLVQLLLKCENDSAIISENHVQVFPHVCTLHSELSERLKTVYMCVEWLSVRIFHKSNER